MSDVRVMPSANEANLSAADADGAAARKIRACVGLPVHRARLGASGGDAESVAVRVRQVALSSGQATFIDGRLELR